MVRGVAYASKKAFNLVGRLISTWATNSAGVETLNHSYLGRPSAIVKVKLAGGRDAGWRRGMRSAQGREAWIQDLKVARPQIGRLGCIL